MYVGMAGRSLTQESITDKRQDPLARAGLWGRLNSHASGRRSGDQFYVYVADRLVLPRLAPEPLLGVNVVAIPAMPLTLGGGTEDAIVMLDTDEVNLYL